MEKRKIKRRHLIYYLRIFDTTTEKILGHLVDITPDGLMLISEEPIKPDTRFHLSMDMPAEIIIESENRRIRFDGMTIRCEPDVNPQFYLTGFKLVDVEETTRGFISQLITFFGFQD